MLGWHCGSGDGCEKVMKKKENEVSNVLISGIHSECLLCANAGKKKKIGKFHAKESNVYIAIIHYQ